MLLASALPGCTVGPDFVRPAAPSFEHYTRQDPAALTDGEGGVTQSLHSGQAVPVLGFQPLPAAYWLLLPLLLCAYGALAYAAKRYDERRWGR